MTPQTDRHRAMLFQHPRFIPVSIGILPAAWMKHREAMDGIVRRHPIIFGQQKDARDYDHLWSPTYATGRHVDSWGCVWENIHDGREAIVTGHPLPTRADVHRLKPPAKVDGAFPHGFMYLRLCDLRGFEEMMVDFAEEPPELQRLIDIVRDYNVQQAHTRIARLNEPGQILYFGDDLGMQTGLPMGPARWRKYLKPCFAAIYRPVADAGHYVYMHTDGHCHEIIADLVDCGVRVVNPQIRANGLDALVAACRGKVCVDLDLDRQLFPFCTPADIDRHVRECVEALGSPEGGLWLHGEVDEGVPLENVEALCQAMEKYRGMFGHGRN